MPLPAPQSTTAPPSASTPPPPPAAPTLRLHQVHKRFANGLQALADVSLAVQPGEFVALLGPSGCGKSTVLRLVAGLDAPSAGQVQAPALAGGPGGDTAFVFQEPTLMPWASVADNVALPLRLAGLGRAERMARVAPVLARVSLADFAQAWPAQLSGGMRMRVSIARALVCRPRVLLMDEPFAALDEITRQHLNTDLLAWWRAEGMATLFVTHSVAEAVFLAQRVLVMAPRPGRIVAERAIHPAGARDAAWRTSTAFAAHCAALSQALEAASRRAGTHGAAA